MYNSADDRTGVWGYCYCTIFEVHMFWLSFTDVSFFFLLLVLDWLYSCAFHSNPAQVGPSESPVLFSGTVGAASTFSPLASNDLPVSVTTVSTNVFFLLTSWLCCHILSSKTFLTFCQEISAMVPPPSTSADRLGSILPEPLNTGDALERYQQVAQKVLIFWFVLVTKILLCLLNII